MIILYTNSYLFHIKKRIKNQVPTQGELKAELSTQQLRSKYKYEIDKIRNKVYNQNYFISLRAIDQILKQFEKFNLKEKPESQDVYLEILLKYAIRFCNLDNESLINEVHIQKAFKDLYKIDTELIKKIQSVEQIRVSEPDKKPVEVETLQEEETEEKIKVAQDELGQPLNIDQVRSRFEKYKEEIEKIREKLQSQKIFINLKGVNEIINSIEKLNLNKRDEFQDEYLEKLLNFSIILCKSGNKNLVDENHIKNAFHIIKPEAHSGELKIESMEKEKISASEELPLEEEVIEDEEVGVSAPDDQIEEIPIDGEKTIGEEIVKIELQEPPEEILPPEPQITNCPFCGLAFDEAPTFCPQCGMIFKKM